MKKLLTILCLVLLVSCSPEPEVEPKILTGPFLTIDGKKYDQETNELLTGVFKNHQSGRLWMKETYKDGLRDGVWEWFHKNGQLWSRRNYKDGELNGLWEWFHDNGQLQHRGNYKEDKKDGLWEYFDEDGNLTKTEEWKDGELIKQ